MASNRFVVVFPVNRVLWVLLAATVSCSAPVTAPTTDPSEDPEPTERTLTESTTTQRSASTTPGEVSQSGVLVFHKTAGFRHDSIEAGIQALTEIAEAEGREVTATDDASVFTAEGLKPYDVVVFLNTTGDVLDDGQQGVMEEFIQEGKGFVGIHSAADTEYDWQWYGGLVGAYFENHPEPQSAAVELMSSHPVVEGMTGQFERFDEWYNFRTRPGPEVTVLATLDESSYEGGEMGQSHPIVWAGEYDGGRRVYIGFGHTSETFAEQLVRTLLGTAIEWAAGSRD
jgi:type 1 glutamine amidotransferase